MDFLILGSQAPILPVEWAAQGALPGDVIASLFPTTTTTSGFFGSMEASVPVTLSLRIPSELLDMAVWGGDNLCELTPPALVPGPLWSSTWRLDGQTRGR